MKMPMAVFQKIKLKQCVENRQSIEINDNRRKKSIGLVKIECKVCVIFKFKFKVNFIKIATFQLLSQEQQI